MLVEFRLIRSFITQGPCPITGYPAQLPDTPVYKLNSFQYQQKNSQQSKGTIQVISIITYINLNKLC